MSVASVLPFILLLLLLLLLAVPPSKSSPVAACKTSTDGDLCRTIIAPLPPSATAYDYAIYAVNSSLEHAHATIASLRRGGAKMRRDGGGALDDCLELSKMSAEYIRSAGAMLEGGEVAITMESADKVHTLMSAALANIYTCMDAIVDQVGNSSSGEVYEQVHRASQLLDVALGLVVAALERIERIQPSPVSSDAWFDKWRPIEPNILTGIVEGVLADRTVTVAADGSGNFTSIQKAVDFAPKKAKNGQGYFKIVIKEGVYREKVFVNKKDLILVGAGINRTVLSGNRSIEDGFQTIHTATFEVQGERFVAYKMSFENTAGPEHHQAVAVTNLADQSVFYQCSFLGYQDTLCVHSNNQFYRECNIYGTIDFIFGNAAAVFQACNIYVRRPMPGQKNTITAQGRNSPNLKTGISIHGCKIRAAPDLEASPNPVTTYLGRPWKKYARVVYMQSFLGSLIDPAGWSAWDGDTSALDKLYYGEYSNHGPGAATGGRVDWPGYIRMNMSDANKFTVLNFISGLTWLPNTSVPFWPQLR